MQVDFNNYLFRCSSLGYIMTTDDSETNREKLDKLRERRGRKQEELIKTSPNAVKTADRIYDQIEKLSEEIDKLKLIVDEPVLSQGCKTHLCDIYTRVKYGRTENIMQKYMEKGLLVEEDVITLHSEVTGIFHKKNKIRKHNEFIEGECDVDSSGMIREFKANWSVFQFMRVAAKPIKPLYKWQVKGYMWLFDKPMGELIYGLVNTPQHLIDAEKKKFTYGFVGSAQDLEAGLDEIQKNHTYDDIPMRERLRIFEELREENDENAIMRQVKECRKFLINLQEQKLNYEL